MQFCDTGADEGPARSVQLHGTLLTRAATGEATPILCYTCTGTSKQSYRHPDMSHSSFYSPDATAAASSHELPGIVRCIAHRHLSRPGATGLEIRAPCFLFPGNMCAALPACNARLPAFWRVMALLARRL